MANSLLLLSTILFVVSVLFLIIAAVLFFVLKIPTVIGDLSGRTAKKSIERMRSNNEKSGVKSYRASNVNANREKLTDVMEKDVPREMPKESNVSDDADDRPETGLLSQTKHVDLPCEETTLLNDTNETALLLDENSLSISDRSTRGELRKKAKIQLKMIEEIILIHTEEVIR